MTDMAIDTGSIVHFRRKVSTPSFPNLAYWDEVVLFPRDLPARLSAEMYGKKASDTFTVTTDQFKNHQRNPLNIVSIPLESIPYADVKRGTVLKSVIGAKEIFATVTEVENGEAVLDINPPQAGEDCETYEVEIIEVRPSTADERAYFVTHREALPWPDTD